jgi:hypothetical protein
MSPFRVARTVNRRRRVRLLAAGAIRPPRVGEVSTLLALMHPDQEWTYLDPSAENLRPQTCHHREQLAGLGGGMQ